MTSKRYARQSFLGPRSEDVLSRIRVGVIGLGGGGSHVVQQLAYVGIQHFILYDPDVVEDTNLNRLIGATTQDALDATPKLEVAERLIRGLQQNAECVSMMTKWQQNDHALRMCDVIFGCVDSFAERADLERFARRFFIPYIDIGMEVHDDKTHFSITGQVARSMPGEPCLWCLHILNKYTIAEEAKKYGAAGGRPQVVWANGVLASTALGLMVEMVTPWHRNMRPVACLEYDGNTQTVEPSNFLGHVVDGECPHHSIEDAGDLFFKLPNV
ncbi:ThiF family adenylyltransferase [Patescibacteria group bacterium]|nr:ThiF family adenylyltransferase [Patescibacteria group bacterium]